MAPDTGVPSTLDVGLSLVPKRRTPPLSGHFQAPPWRVKALGKSDELATRDALFQRFDREVDLTEWMLGQGEQG